MEINMEKAQPYTFDLGYMMCTDANPLPSLTTLTPEEKNTTITSIAQECAQALINQLLTTCPITRNTEDGALQITLPGPAYHLPREKSVPKEKEKSKWEKFADKKGIKPKQRDGKMVFDEASGEWKPKYGYKGKDDGKEWLVEVEEEKAEVKEGTGGGGKPLKGRKGNPKEIRGGPERREKKMKSRKGK
jgi:hypothetical protein